MCAEEYLGGGKLVLISRNVYHAECTYGVCNGDAENNANE